MNVVQKPDLYHGKNKKTDFFEGWYFKIVDKDNLYKFAFIPGISLGKTLDEQHSFIQIVDGFNVKYNYLKFRKNDFKYNNKDFNVCVNSNSFSLDNINLNLKYDNKYIKGNLKFKNIVKWKDSIINPG
ncbi:MAG: tocopherol cyclase family protein, partial [Peptostreptococcaceae bacterium]